MLLRARHLEFCFPRPTLILGVVNVTPDSFSDGGAFLTPAAAIAHGLELAAAGADFLDVGGESTRPGAEPVSTEEELRRVLPVIEGLRARIPTPISIDTTKCAVAAAALALGAVMVNDVGAATADDSMRALLVKTGAAYVAMHMQGTPRTMQSAPVYEDVVAEVEAWCEGRLAWARAGGVPDEQVIFDPGIGFGKTADHNLQLLARLNRLTKWGRPLMVGVSRKSFISKISGPPSAQERLGGSLAGAVLAVSAGAQLIRAHDVAATRQAVAVTEAILSQR